MIQARKDANTSKESIAEEQVALPTTQQIRSVPVEQQRTAIVTNALGAPTTVILPENSRATDASNFQFHRLAIGGQLQHVVTSLQVPGPSSTVSEAVLTVNPRCTVASPQDVAHILVATTTNSLQTGVGLQNSIVNISASTHQQLQTLGSIAGGGQRTKHELCGTVFTQPTAATTVAQRIVLNSGMSDVFALRIAPTTMTGGVAPQQIMVLESSTGLVPSSDVTKVHSYSLASASASAPSPSSGIQKVVTNSAGQVFQTSSIPHKALIAASGSHTQLRTPVKRPLVTNPSRDVTSSVNSVTEVVSCLSNVNKLLSGLLPAEGKIMSGIPNSPKPKKIKLEKNPIVSKETIIKRRKVAENLLEKIRMLKIKYYIQQAEYFFLKNGGNMMDYLAWRKKCPSALVEYLRANPIEKWESDSKLVMEVMLHGSSLFSFGTSSSLQGADSISSMKSAGSMSSSHSHLSPSRLSSSPSSAAQRLSGAIPATATTTVTKSVRQPLVAHKLASKHNSLSSVYDSQIGSQEEIVERAKQEAYVMQRIGNLRREGLWSLRRLPKVQEQSRNKAHWDYLLEEMVWLATDFAQERKWKKAAAKKCARMITKYFQEKEIKAEKAEREEQMRLRKIACTMAKDIKMFWNNIEKLVEYKQQTWLEEKRKKALDVHLNFIVDQTEKYSSWLTQGMNRSFKDGTGSSRGSSPVHESGLSTPRKRQHSKSYDVDFEPLESETDDEETIKKEETLVDEFEQKEEIKKLKEESDIPLENLLESLPSDFLTSSSFSMDNMASEEHVHTTPESLEIKEEVCEDETQALQDSIADDDCDFQVSGDEEDDEQTILEQEKQEIDTNYEEEIKELEAENEMSIEELREKYAGAFSSDFHMPDSDDSSSENEESMDENGSDNSGDENSEVDVTTTPKDEPMDTSVSPKKTKSHKEKVKDEEPSKDITDIAATAESFQPKGNTLSTTQVYTKVPFLLKHQLREYQHIGLDWMNAMYDKKLNGILADEMGLGKTIQTISILAHLACENGVWGPHLIVVPTSVMLNWEMEFKKWCPAFKILTYYGTPKERKQKRMGWTKPNTFHICITSYKLVVQDHVSFRRKRWKYLILDEAQHIKNFKSQRWQLLLNFQSTHRLLLTGTPLQNNLMELWSLMHFLMPNVFQSHREFREWFVNPVTGMIEGSHEYNESLIKRLHKVLRPFLLRRLKCEVEKQLPKKYEHVVMCRLSKRQRYLYDDFMSQTKTKETLATGSFMSVINILMQLRKVCNHPNMFEERPTVSPFLMEGITYHTASLVCNAIGYDPFKHINLLSLNLLLADLELCLTAFAAHRVMKLRTPATLIHAVEHLPEPPPPCPFWKTKINFCNSQGSGRSSPIATQVRGVAPTAAARIPQPPATRMPAVNTVPYPQRYMVIPGQQAAPATRSTSPVAAVSGHPIIGQTQSGEYTLQLLPQAGTGVPVAQLAPIGGQVVTSTQLTLQIQPSAQGGARVSMPLGIGRLVQTATGPHIVITSTMANAVSDPQQVPASVSSTMSFSTTPNTATNAQSMVLSTNIATATVLPQVQKIGTPSVTSPFLATFTRPQNSPVVTSPASQTMYNKPIGRVAPLNVHPPSSTTSGTTNQNHIQSNKGPVVHSLSKSHRSEPPVTTAASEKKNSLFYLDSLVQRQEKSKKESLACLARVNLLRCAACPIYGKDLIEAVTVTGSVEHSTESSLWCGKGYVNCLNASAVKYQRRSYWHYTESLSEIVSTPEKCICQLREIINRFVFVIPAVSSPPIQLHISHPCPSWANNENRRIQELNSYLLPRCALLHPIIRNMKTQFPELRLIQYDCGKLQRLALLLWELKSNHHRVLIFTQMTRMLDILEQFLNYHGHTYLRLDGNTKVEQRQALMERFNADKRIFCFILSTRSGGIGVNLTGADTVVFYDSDWNPTMDAQAQDRCHRIGQTRDVHIYRLISVKTIEENILKKANQKRILGNLAIEGGNFTTAFFKTNTIHELFGIEPQEDTIKMVAENKKKTEDVTDTENEKISESQLGQALGMAEEESDLQAAKTAHAEAAAELAEFDESIPLDDGRDNEEKSPGEEELDKLMEQLTPVEKYAMQFLESLQEPVSLEQLKLAEEEIEAQKKDWELGHLKALKEEEERRAGLLSDEDPMLYYSRSDAYNQMYFSINGQEEMPLWAPPTPPQNENDIYIDHSLGFLYKQTIMHESFLPPIFIKKEAKRLKVDPVVSAVSTSRKQKVRKDDMVNIPRSLFDRPSAAILKMRREAKLQKVKGLMVGASSISKPVGSFTGLKQPPIVVNKPAVDALQDKPEWMVHEDWSILQVVQDLQSLPLSLTVLLPAHVPNWDLAADATNILSRVYRSSRLCRNRYESVIVPREEGKILYDTNPKKQKKTKGIYKTKNNRPMKTSQLYTQDNNASFTLVFNTRLKHISDFVQKRKPPEKPSFLQASKHLKHSTVLVENGIGFDQPLTPMQIASNRAERISREKQKNQPVIVAQTAVQAPGQVAVQAVAQVTEQQLAAQRQAQAHQQATTVTVAGTANLTQHQAQAVIASLAQAQQLQQAAQLNKANIQPGTVPSVSLTKSLASGIMVSAAPGTNAGAFATISKALGQAGVTAVSAQGQNATIAALTSATLRNPRATVTAVGTTTTMTVQEMVAAAAAAGQVRGLTTTTGSNTSTVPAVVSVSGLTAVQLQASQRLPGTAISPGTTVASVNQLNAQAATQRNITQLSQIQAIRQTALIRQRESLKQQQLKRLQTVQQQATQQAAKVAVGSSAQLTVAAAQQRVAQQQAMKQSVGRAMTEAEMAQIMKRQQLQQQKQAQLTTAQILAQAQLQQVQQQQVSITCGTATLVKTVSAPSLSGTPSVAIPVSAVTMGGVNINVSLPQGKTGAAQTKGTTTTITNQQLRQIQLHQQQLLNARKGGKVANLTQLAKVSGKAAGISPSSLTTPINAVQIVQHGQAGGTQQVKGLQAAMTVQQIQQAMKNVIPPNLPVVVTATPSLSGIQQQSTLRGEPAVVTGSVKPQTTTLPSTTLTTSGVLKGSPAVVVGQQQTAAILQQVAASSAGLTPQQAVTLAVRAAASQAQGQQQVQIQVQQSPHSSLVSPQSQVVSAALQSSQARIQQISSNQSTINISQPVQNVSQASGVMSSAATIVSQMPADSTIQSPTHVVMHSMAVSNSSPVLSIPAALTSSSTASTNAQVVQAAMQVARQQAAQQAAQQQQQKASPYTMRLRNPPK